MSRNLKAVGLALLAICAMGALAAQGASATTHKFHSDGIHTTFTGKAIEGNHTFAVGTAGTVECTTAEFKGTQTGVETPAGSGTWVSDTLTVIPKYTGCTFGGQPATVTVPHCAYVFYGETTSGNSTGGEHATVELECSEGGKIEIDTSVCTITVGPQKIKDAVRYENDTESSIIVKATAHKVVTGKVKSTESQTGCLLFPTGEIGTYKGTVTSECFRDEASKTPENTEKTTPEIKHGSTTKCSVQPGK